MLPPLPSTFEYDESVVFFQRATQTRIVGRDSLERSIQHWEHDFRTEVDGDDDANEDTTQSLRRSVRLQTIVSTTLSPTSLLLRWNLTYVDPSIAWLLSFADVVPGWNADYRSYTDQASNVRRFSYSALGRLFADAVKTGKLRVPLACIEGTATCRFREEENNEGNKRIVSITEDLAYAQDLKRGVLSNRVCARDLQFFLEVARKPPEYWNGRRNQGNTNGNNAVSAKDDNTNTQQQQQQQQQHYEYWEEYVTDSLPWKTVPGMMDPMYIESQSEEDLASNLPLAFGTLSVVLVMIFANWIAPDLIGQSLFGDGRSFDYVPTEELNRYY